MIDYYAKSFSEGGKRRYGELLSSHLEKTLYYARKLIKRYNIDDYHLIKAIEVAVAFHDIGKADYRFQDYLINGKSSTHKRVFHPLLGLPIVEKISDIVFNNDKIHSDKKNKIKKKSHINRYLKNLVVLAVASHHTALHQELYSQISQYDEIQFLKVADRKRFHKIVNNLCEQIGIDSVDLLDCYDKVSYQSLTKAKFDIPVLNSIEGVKLRELFVTIQGILNYSDWLASEANNEKFFLSQLNLNENFLDSPYDYQIKAKDTTGNTFITLPTGSGKTETALCWIAKNFVPGFRIFYALPTKTTINSMYKRLIDKERKYGLDTETVSLYYSNIDLYLYLEGQDPRRSFVTLYKNFFYPFNVTTPDQLILAIMNHNRYTLKSFMMKRSVIVFDEIHAYDSETFALIKSLIKYLQQNYDVKFCIMSATFPEILKKELSFLKAKELVDKKYLKSEYSKRHRTQLQFFEKYVTDSIEDILSFYKQGKRVLVVLNTVSRAQRVFLKLRDSMKKQGMMDTDLWLIHSRYTFEDRKTREARLDDKKNIPKILVATQIVEVSLDIDYNAMFTEACYPDALVQRSGRVNRKGGLGNNGEGKILIFLPEGWNERKDDASLPYDKRLLEDSISLLKERANSITSELDYIKITNEFYDKSWITDIESETRFQEIWKRVDYIYRVDMSDEDLLKLMRTRSGILTVNAYSITHWPEIESMDKEIEIIDELMNSNQIDETDAMNKKYDLYQKIRMFSINIPIIKSIKFADKFGKGNRKYTLVEAEYNEDLGLKINL